MRTNAELRALMAAACRVELRAQELDSALRDLGYTARQYWGETPSWLREWMDRKEGDLDRATWYVVPSLVETLTEEAR